MNKEYKIVAISDTHSQHNKLIIPKCDFLIHAGDESGLGRQSEIEDFAKWFNKQPAKHKIWVPGNHSVRFEEQYPNSLKWFTKYCPKGIVLIDKCVTIEGIKIYGSPWSPFFCNWAYNAGRSDLEAATYNRPLIKDIWKKIDKNVNILITHGPPYQILDDLHGRYLGCVDLRDRIEELKDLDIHISGHIHINGGKQKHIDGKSYYNASICDESYQPINDITIIDYIK